MHRNTEAYLIKALTNLFQRIAKNRVRWRVRSAQLTIIHDEYMEERFINLARPDEIVKELFHDNSEVLNEFSGQFSKELLEFAELFS